MNISLRTLFLLIITYGFFTSIAYSQIDTSTIDFSSAPKDMKETFFADFGKEWDGASNNEKQLFFKKWVTDRKQATKEKKALEGVDDDLEQERYSSQFEDWDDRVEAAEEREERLKAALAKTEEQKKEQERIQKEKERRKQKVQKEKDRKKKEKARKEAEKQKKREQRIADAKKKQAELYKKIKDMRTR